MILDRMSPAQLRRSRLPGWDWRFINYETVEELRRVHARLARAPAFAWQDEMVESFAGEIRQRENER